MKTILSITLVLGICSIVIAQSEPLSVCQALTSASDHQELIVQGRASGTVHGLYLTEGINSDPCPGWPKHFFTAPSLIGLEFTSSYGVTLTNEQQQLNRDLLLRLHRLRVAGQLENHMVKLRGVLVRTSCPLILRRADGSYHGFGMGPDGGLSAVVVIRAILEEGEISRLSPIVR